MSRMPNKRFILISIIIVGIIVIGLSFNHAAASTGCFNDTNGNMFETYICWMKENAITGGCATNLYCPDAYVTRGQMAVFMQKAANIPPWTGDIYVHGALGSLQPNATYASTASVRYYSDVVQLRTNAVTSNYYQIFAELPVSLYNKATLLKGVQVCYNATTSGGTLTRVNLELWSGGAIPAVYAEVDT